MDRRIDLDAAAREVERRLDGWRACGVIVGPITWRDASRDIKTRRHEANDPDSIGIRCTKGDREGSLVLYAGGWADLEYWSGAPTDEPLLEHPGYENWLTIESFAALLDRFGALFTDSQRDRTA